MESARPQRSLLYRWVRGLLLFAAFVAVMNLWGHLDREQPRSYQPTEPAATTEWVRDIDCDDPFMDPGRWDLYCGGAGFVEPEPQDGPVNRGG